MPKVVDHAERRDAIAQAALTLVGGEGTAALSVRRVAAASGLSPGALRHYFAAQDELVAFIAEYVTGAAAERVMRTLDSATDVDGCAQLLGQLIPLDRQRAVEFDVWLEMLVLSRTSELLRPMLAESHEQIGRLCALVVARLAAGLSARERERESADLHALLDGLGLQLSVQSDAMTPRQARAVLKRRLNALSKF